MKLCSLHIILGSLLFYLGTSEAVPYNVPSAGLEEIQDAIDLIDVTEVLVSPKNPTNDPYASIVMKPNVSVRAVSGTPRIHAKDTAGQNTAYAVQFPVGSTTAAILEGFTIIGTSGASRVVDVRDAGVINNCTIQGSDLAGQIGLYHEGATSTACQQLIITMNGATPNRIGMKLVASNFAADYGRIEVRGGANSYGIQNTSGIGTGGTAGPKIRWYLVKAPGGTGIEMNIPAGGIGAAIRHCTVDSTNSYGIKAPLVLSGTEITDCIATNSSGPGAREISAQPGTVKDCIAWPHGFNGNGHDCGQCPYGNKVEDPLFCNPAAGSYALRFDSFGNPDFNLHIYSDEDPTIGAFAVGCAYGTLVRNPVWGDEATEGSLDVLGDLVIGNQKTLTVNSNAVLKAAGTDLLAGGDDEARVEIIVENNGTLSAVGSAPSKAKFKSGKIPTGEGDWWGIRVEPGGQATVNLVDIQHAQWGVAYQSTRTGSVANSVFSNNAISDIHAGVGGGNMALSISGNAITVGSSRGIGLESTVHGVTVSGNTITGNSTSSAGIQLLQFTDGEDPSLIGNTISGFINGYGIDGKKTETLIKTNTISGSKYGIYFKGGSADIGTDSTSDNFVTNNSDGILVDSTATPVIRNNQVTGNVVGVKARFGGNPDLGTSGSFGKNSFLSNSTYCLWNRNTSGTINAWGNYFGGCDPEPLPCWEGSFVIEILCTQPAGVGFDMVAFTDEAKSLRMYGVRPNPMTLDGRIFFRLGQGAAGVDIRVFDVAGRLVRDLGGQMVGAGESQFQWDGRDNSGVSVPSGIYFVRVATSDGLQGTAKVIVAR